MNYNKKVSLIFILILSVVLLQCQKNPTGPETIKDLFPLAVGNYWMYVSDDESSPLGYKIQEEIIGYDKLSDGSLVFVKRKISSYESASVVDTVISYLQFAGDEFREYPDNNCILEYKILLKNPLQVGARWDTYSDTSCRFPGIVVNFISDEVEGIENITVPSGTFNDCFRIVTCNCPDFTDYRWFAPYVGIVRLDIVRFWGGVKYVLKEYRVR